MTQKPWEHAKSAGSEGDPLAARFVESLSFDRRLYRHDIAGSLAHARMLAEVGLLGDGDLSAIEKGLNQIEAEIDREGDAWPGWKIELEDVHMCIEAALIEKIGEPGRKLHTGRSRNDQVAADLKLWLHESRANLTDALGRLIASLIDLAERDGRIVMPSYTHLQRAQPIVVGGEVLAWASAFDRCAQRLDDQAWHNDDNPLGSGAIAGSALPLDRESTTRALAETAGFLAPSVSSIESTASRDAGLDFVYALSMTSMWLSRWAEQWIIYMSAEFGFLKIGDAYTTGSSMMPQKRNPDMLELIRGRSGAVYGHLVALLTLCKGLTIGYNRDLQEDKRHVFSAYDLTLDSIDMASRIAGSAEFDEQRIRQGLDRGFLDATALAEYLVTRGVAFRTAHQHVGAMVRLCESKGLERLKDLSVDDMRSICGEVDEEVYGWLGPENVVRRYRTFGNAGISGFEQQLAGWKQRLGEVDDGADADDPAEDEAEPGGDGDTAVSANRSPGADSVGETAGSANGLFGGAGRGGVDLADEQEAAMVGAYQAQGRTLDDLPYTPQFEAIMAAIGDGPSRREVFQRLHNLRKAGRLPTGLKAWEKAPRVEDDQALDLRRRVEQSVGRLSNRDQLPFTDGFESLVQAFNEQHGLSFSPYQVWRVIAKLAK